MLMQLFELLVLESVTLPLKYMGSERTSGCSTVSDGTSMPTLARQIPAAGGERVNAVDASFKQGEDCADGAWTTVRQ
jgi:hypothetical protein